jgi:hypothetical protein
MTSLRRPEAPIISLATATPARVAVAALIALAALATGCAPAEETMPKQEAATPAVNMDPVAEGYVKLVLAVGLHDSNYVDAYYGPEKYKTEAEAEALPLESIRSEAEALIAKLPAAGETGGGQIVELRRSYLATQLRALVAHVDQLGGMKMTFDEESKALYDAVAPSNSDEYFQGILNDLEKLLPGSGALSKRLEDFKKDFIIPSDKLDTIFRAAIDACRERTAKHMELPIGENFTIEYVTDKPWSGYNWYQGHFQSLIQVNTDLPIYIDRAIDLACHEGYPGHHVYNALLEWRLSVERGWVEHTVYPLYSPQSLIAEGSANYGIEMAFPGDERVEFEKMNLFPLAGLDSSRAALYYDVIEKAEQLAYAGNEAARLYLDGEIDAKAAADRLEKYSLMERARAQQRVRFIETYRAYVINYNLGKDLVRDYVEREGGRDTLKRWEVFTRLLSTPRLPSELK